MADSRDERRPKRQRRDRRSMSPARRREQQTSSRESGRSHRNCNDEYDERDGPRIQAGTRGFTTSLSDTERKGRSTRTGRDEDIDKERHRTRSDRNRSRSRSTSRRRRKSHKRRDDSRDRFRPSRRRDRHDPNRSSHSQSPRPHRRSKAPLPSQNDAFTSKDNASTASEPVPDKQKPNFKPTGKLAALSNTVQTAGQTIVLKYHEPAESRKPPASQAWRLYIFKDDAILDTVELATQSCWLFGRELAVVDIPIEHPSCSKQHAVIQFRYVEKRTEFGDRVGRVRPYVLDLESANGTSVNGAAVPQAKYVELRDKDVVTFGESTREYVVQLPAPTVAS